VVRDRKRSQIADQKTRVKRRPQGNGHNKVGCGAGVAPCGHSASIPRIPPSPLRIFSELPHFFGECVTHKCDDFRRPELPFLSIL
jgi:hypothetical protein